MTNKLPKRHSKPGNRDDAEQSKRFIEIGRALGADKDEKALARGLKKLAHPKKGS